MVRCSRVFSKEKSNFSQRKPWVAVETTVHEIHFNTKNSNEKILDYRDLKAWGENRNFTILPDLPFRGIQDFEAAVIVPDGLSFSLDATGFHRNYLYLDMVTYTIPEKSPKKQVNWIDVIVNGRSLAIFYEKSQKILIVSPLIVPIEREDMPYGKIHVILKSSPNAFHFAIWDAFVTRFPSQEKGK